LGNKHSTKLKRGSRSSSYAAVLKRVGTTPEDRAGWLIRLAAMNWDDLSADERISWRREGTLFISKDLYHPNNDPYSEDTILLWQGEMRGCLVGIKNNNYVFTLKPKVQYTFWVSNGKLCHEPQYRVIEDAFANEIFRALSGAGNHFRFCLHCQTPFVTTHRQGYCSISCSRKVRIQRYKEKDPERWKRRGHY